MTNRQTGMDMGSVFCPRNLCHVCSASADSDGAGLKGTSIYDYLVMNVCLDARGNPTAASPLECPLSSSETCCPAGPFPMPMPAIKAMTSTVAGSSNDEYSYPLSKPASDQTGAGFPLIVGWLDAAYCRLQMGKI